MINKFKIWIFKRWFMNLFLGALDCLDLEVSIDDDNLKIKRQTNVGTISFDKLFKCDRLNVKKLIEQIYALKVDSTRKKYSATVHQMQQYVYGAGALSKQQLDECVAYCMMIERGQIKLAEVEENE